MKIESQIVADSKNQFGNRLTTFLVTFPRIILAELNTHRMFSRNSASSRAIPYKKMLRSVMTNPFIPIAWQKDHVGMQGKEYLSKTKLYKLGDFIDSLNSLLDNDLELVNTFKEILSKYNEEEKILDDWWLFARDKALEASAILSCLGVTKQLCNRLLEPFMWHTVIVSATEWENFFALRCSQYSSVDTAGTNVSKVFRSSKNWKVAHPGAIVDSWTEVDWLSINKGQAEIHMMALAESMWDSYKESIPKLLKAGEWHICYEDKINEIYGLTQKDLDIDGIPYSVKIGCVMAARTSYTVVGTELSDWTKEKYSAKCDELSSARPIHASPFEHCAKSMTELERNTNLSGKVETRYYSDWSDKEGDSYQVIPDNVKGWSGNFRGFIQYRKMLPNENITS